MGKAVSCINLLDEYHKYSALKNTQKILFEGVEGYDVYNITAPFECKGKEYIAGRVELRENEISHVRIFERISDDRYRAVMPDVVFEKFQDPCVSKIAGNIVLGGVQIETDPLHPKKIISWKMIFYKGEDLEHLELLTVGPNYMKDIRLIELRDGRIGIFTRPQGKIGGLGKIGFIAVDSLADVTAENMMKAAVFHSHFVEGEWGGVNEVHVLDDGRLGVLGHISYKNGERHYHPMAFIFDPETMEHSPIRIIAQRKDVSDGPAKRPDLQDVLFTGGLKRNPGAVCRLYMGVSDCEAYYTEIDDPFQ